QAITFSEDTTLSLSGIKASLFYPGKGHTADNCVVWLADKKILFGGCLIKSAQATDMGNIAEADLEAWPQTIRLLYQKYGAARYVVPGHQQWGDLQLLTHTLELLKKVKQ
ncbi:MAG: subclass B1 metallo-beta-lactamase, partial [Bacteroidetes bacterium]|nr:subclass B1 metallo-beta-lactamase [Bacteroidota bacterium]